MTTICGQEGSPFLTAAYAYILRTDALPSTDAASDDPDPLCVVKLFYPTGSWSWFVAGFDPDTTRAFGVVHGFEREAGDFMLNELKALRLPFGLRIERDLHWSPKRMSELL